MYIPKLFNVCDNEDILSFIKANSFGQLISLAKGKLVSSHIPFLLSNDKQLLKCHLAKSNSQWQDIENQEVLITFQGPHDYVSPSWYNSAGVPTWNYQAVHIYGKPQLITNTETLSRLVNELTGIYESCLDKPWEPEYKVAMLKAIIGIEIKITDIQCKYKLSQNRSADDRLRVIEEHKKRGSLELAKATKDTL